MAQHPPSLLDLILLHLQDDGWQVNGWHSQGDPDCIGPYAWLTVTATEYLYISTTQEGLVNITTGSTHLTTLDPASPKMFDQLDTTLREMNGGSTRSYQTSPQ